MSKIIKGPKSAGKREKYIIPDRQSTLAFVEEASAAYASVEIKKVTQIMGMPERKSEKASNYDSYFIHLIRKGVPRKAIDHLMSATGFSEDEMSSILHVSKRTLQRRDPAALLNPEQSERLIEIAKLYTKGADVFGDLASFREWMEKKVIALGSKKPKEFLDTSIGIKLLLDELGRIQHGVFA